MQEIVPDQKSILVLGNGKLAYSVYVCILNSGHKTQLLTEDRKEAMERINLHLTEMHSSALADVNCDEIRNINPINENTVFDYIIIVSAENMAKKRSFLKIAEQFITCNTVIAINSESFALSSLQESALYPHRIIGANWTEPAHTTFFLEIISNKNNPPELVEEFCSFAKKFLMKDPYVLKNDFGIRARMMCAMIREAFYLVKNGYVSIEDIDRACRNDAGYYLPFTGNFRYMDLMGTFIYGVVMKDLNPELSKDTALPAFFKQIIKEGGEGMKNNHGFYQYVNGDTKKRDDVFRTFSYQIQKIIEKYIARESEQKIPATDLITLTP